MKRGFIRLWRLAFPKGYDLFGAAIPIHMKASGFVSPVADPRPTEPQPIPDKLRVKREPLPKRGNVTRFNRATK
jgi:hypothetical protein